MAERVDKLGRGEFIKFVKSLILKSDQYKRDNDSKSYVMALDSAWGTGKTYFLDLFCQDITQQDITQEDKLKIVRYNAWKNDYCENAFEPLIYDILMSDCLSFPMENIFDAKNLQKMISEIAKIGRAMGEQFVFSTVKNKYGIDVKKAFKEVKGSEKAFKNFLLRQSQELNEINQERVAFEKFKESLGEATSYLKDNKQKLVVIIDELDRCKPTFAIQTLEVVKHLFDIDNIVFLFAVDIQQLSHSISSVYGQGFDSAGYLCRFFDYIAKLPEPDIYGYINENLSTIDFIKDDLSCFDIDNFLNEIYKVFNFTLRDLETLIKSYRIMLNNFLSKYIDKKAHCMYIFFLALKYKYPDFFSKVFVNKNLDFSYLYDEVYKKIKTKLYGIAPFIESFFDLINQDLNLYRCAFSLKLKGNEEYFTISKIIDNDKIAVYYVARKGSLDEFDVINYKDSNLKDVLFQPDLQNWENINNITYREYIYKQLEMYNFYNSEMVE